MPHLSETTLLKRDHPVAEVITSYGISLRPAGRALVGRCPFHADRGRPNLYVYAASQSWYCYRCATGGDVIRFIEMIEGVGFRAAIARLVGDRPAMVTPPTRPGRKRPVCRTRHIPPGTAERACLAAAVELYQNRLLADPATLAYLDHRGIDRDTIERCRLGFAAGDELVDYLRWRRLPIQAARRVGLLDHLGRDVFAGRVVVPEIRVGRPIWLIGRTIEPNDAAPKYLGLPGRKPLLGWESADGSPAVWVVEGAFDWLTLRGWGFPTVALTGTRVRAEALAGLQQFERVFLALDNDAAGHKATAELRAFLGERAVALSLPEVKDIAELAVRPDGRARFRDAVRCVTLPVAA